MDKDNPSRVHKELLKEAKLLGYNDPDEAVRSIWKDIPKWLQDDLLELGFDPKKKNHKQNTENKK